MNESRCVECEAFLFEPEGIEKSPCPVCGSMGRYYEARIEEVVSFGDGYRMKLYEPGSSKFVLDDRSGPSYYRVKDEWHYLERTIDRKNDRYKETVRVLRTGEILRQVDEPFSQHIGRGGARNQGRGGEA